MYYLLFSILYLVSLLPFWILYGISDTGYFILYHIFGYRKRVTLENLSHAFPEKSKTELEQIMRRFYRGFCDQWIEVVKLISISKRQLNKRVKGNWEVFAHFNDIDKNVYTLLGHQFNWELGSVATQWNVTQQFAGVYLPQSNKAFDRLMLYIRKRSGAVLVSAKEMKAGFSALQHRTYVLAFMADQSPASNTIKWIPFMNRPAAFFLGPEKMARRAGAAVVYAAVQKVKRGHYYVHLQVITEDASALSPGAITVQYVNLLENELRRQPENWLWTHRRWKKQPPQNVINETIAHT